ncbi:DoxX family protein [Microvirga yunnanensis]|uniref:DoxX family protein n=1 Tax=Microvirga yunnanensis TaxID=2953740 RepID=UPI0021CA6765|nr:DoxX family protein [Microvirga sp. HBU65207]
MLQTFEVIASRAANPLLLVGRLLLALIFLHEAVTLSFDFTAAASAMSKIGVPPYVLVLTILLQLGAGLMVASGWHARLGSLSLGLFCLATAFLFHSNFAIRNELLHFEKDLAIAGGMFVLTATGAGALSLDRLVKHRSPFG